MKKKLVITLIIVLLLVIVICSSCVNVQDNAYAEKNSVGYELEEFSVKINYCYYVKYISGLYFAFEVIFDKDFYSTIDDKTAVFNSLKDTFVKNNYKINIDMVNGKMSAYMDFDSVTDYYIAAGMDGYETNVSDKAEKKSFLYTYYVSENTTVFSDIKKDGKFINRIYNACLNIGLTDEDIVLNYIYGTPYNEKLLTSDADSVSYSVTDRLYYHYYMMNMAETDRLIKIKQRVPNSTGWYFIAILTGIVVLSIPLVIYLLKKKKEKRNG